MDGRTDMMKLIGVFQECAEASKFIHRCNNHFLPPMRYLQTCSYPFKNFMFSVTFFTTTSPLLIDSKHHKLAASVRMGVGCIVCDVIVLI